MGAASFRYVNAKNVKKRSKRKEHTGPWRDVKLAWRRLYACACVRISRCLVKEDGDFKEAMRVLDMANMMCDDRSREMIEKEVRVVEVALRRTTEEDNKKRPNTTSIETESPPKKKIKTVDYLRRM